MGTVSCSYSLVGLLGMCKRNSSLIYVKLPTADLISRYRTVDTDTLCLLLRLRFWVAEGNILAAFSPEFKFHSPSLELYDMSLSEEVICTVCVDESRHFVLSVLNWRRRTVASRVTTVQLVSLPPTHSLNY